jgi:hypothetical protein
MSDDTFTKSIAKDDDDFKKEIVTIGYIMLYSDPEEILCEPYIIYHKDDTFYYLSKVSPIFKKLPRYLEIRIDVFEEHRDKMKLNHIVDKLLFSDSCFQYKMINRFKI